MTKHIILSMIMSLCWSGSKISQNISSFKSFALSIVFLSFSYIYFIFLSNLLVTLFNFNKIYFSPCNVRSNWHLLIAILANLIKNIKTTFDLKTELEKDFYNSSMSVFRVNWFYLHVPVVLCMDFCVVISLRQFETQDKRPQYILICNP